VALNGSMSITSETLTYLHEHDALCYE